MVDLLKAKLKTSQIIVICGISCCLLTILISFILYMPMLRWVIKTQKALKQGNEIRDFYLKLPISLDFRVYFFNVTNPLEVQQGHKPILKEVGPYCYDAFKEKIVVSENKDNDTLTYTPHDTYFFNQTRTGQLSQDDYVTILNPLVVGIVNAVAALKPQFLGAVNKALPIIFQENYSMYITAKIKDILFDGVRIDCNVKEFAATAMCSQFKGQPVFRETGEKNIYMFSLFGSRNGTSVQQITVYRGIKNGTNLGNVVAIDNRPDLGIWPTEECNEFRGTDGWVFPSFLKEDLYVVAPDLCRNFKAQYIEDISFHGVKAKKYFTVISGSDEEDQCYCPSPDKCLPKGVMDLTKCLQVPILCTLPHFFGTDESLLDQVEGLHPNKEKHIIKIFFEPVTGTPMMGQRRIQFNLQIQPLKKISLLQNVSEVIHPVLWLEEGVELEGYLLDKIITISTLLQLVSIGRYFVLAASIQAIAYGCYLMYQEWKSSKIQPVEDPPNQSKMYIESVKKMLAANMKNNQNV